MSGYPRSRSPPSRSLAHLLALCEDYPTLPRRRLTSPSSRSRPLPRYDVLRNRQPAYLDDFDGRFGLQSGDRISSGLADRIPIPIPGRSLYMHNRPTASGDFGWDFDSRALIRRCRSPVRVGNRWPRGYQQLPQRNAYNDRYLSTINFRNHYPSHSRSPNYPSRSYTRSPIPPRDPYGRPSIYRFPPANASPSTNRRPDAHGRSVSPQYGAFADSPGDRPDLPESLGGFLRGTKGYEDWVKHLGL